MSHHGAYVIADITMHMTKEFIHIHIPSLGLCFTCTWLNCCLGRITRAIPSDRSDWKVFETVKR